MLYLGVGTGRIAAPLHRAGIEIVGVDAHPGMLAHLRHRIPGIEVHQSLLEDLELRRRFDLVIGPSSIFESDANLAAAVRHLRRGGRVGMELMNPRWLRKTRHPGVRIRRKRSRASVMEVDYRLANGSVVIQVVEGWKPGPAPEQAARRLSRFGLELLWRGPKPGHTLDGSPTYYVLAGRAPT